MLDLPRQPAPLSFHMRVFDYVFKGLCISSSEEEHVGVAPFLTPLFVPRSVPLRRVRV